jgi:hypothetical protein
MKQYNIFLVISILILKSRIIKSSEGKEVKILKKL